MSKFIFIILLAFTVSCGSARGNGTVFISEQSGPNGERCYVFWNDGKPFAGQCR